MARAGTPGTAGGGVRRGTRLLAGLIVMVAAAGAVGQSPGTAGAAAALTAEPDPGQTSWRSLSVSRDASCAIRADQTLWCWGGNGAAQLGDGTREDRTAPVPTGGAATWTSVAVGMRHGCAVRTDGTLWCWGTNSHGQTGGPVGRVQLEPTPVGTATAWATVAAGGTHSCALQLDGSLWCWGSDTAGQVGDGSLAGRKTTPLRVGADTFWQTVATGYSHTCAIRRDAALWCWGSNSYSELGDGSFTNQPWPVPVAAGMTWANVAAGYHHTCAVRTDGTLWCWGDNCAGQLGFDSTVTCKTTPSQVGVETTWRSVTAGEYHTCGIRTDDTLRCWGTNILGELGVLNYLPPGQMALVAAGAPWSTAAAGGDHTCGIRTNGTLWCWGHNAVGQLGDGSRLASYVTARPTNVAPGTRWRSGTTGMGMCGYQTDGSLWCWGYNSAGHLWTPPPAGGSPLVRLGDDATWTRVAVGDFHLCGIRADRSLWCWGDNKYGQVGDGTTETRTAPARVAAHNPDGTPATWAFVAAGGLDTCGIRTDGSLWCWGYHNENGESRDRYAPVRIGTATGWVSLSMDLSDRCGLRTDQSLWCWGGNYHGAAGDGTTTVRSEPVRVGGDTRWAAVDVGGGHACGLQIDGSLWCWGGNAFGQLGDDSVVERLEPVRVGGDSSWTAVATGGAHSCAIRVDGSLLCWGSNRAGQLAEVPITQRSRPAPVVAEGSGGTAVSGWRSVIAGNGHTCAIGPDAALWCWGSGSDGTLGFDLTGSVLRQVTG